MRRDSKWLKECSHQSLTGRKESRRGPVFYTEVRESVLVAQTPHSQ